MELPHLFEARMKALLKDEYDAFRHCLQTEDAVKGLRVNTQKVSAQAFFSHAPFAVQPLSYVDGGAIVSEDAQAGKHPYHHAGAYYMQDPGAMATAAAIPQAFWSKRDLRILDLCAAPGGKTTQLAARCAAQGGVVIANEYNAARSRILAGNVERMGLSNVCVLNVDSRYPAEWYPNTFDLVVVDAPCSGEGMYRKNELAISEWSPENVAACATRQKEILENGARAVAAGGYLLYATCTYATEENEQIIADFLAANPAFSLCACQPSVVEKTADGVDVTGGSHPELALCRRFYPHRSPGEGQFIALMQKHGEERSASATCKDTFRPLSKAEHAAVSAYLEETVGQSMEGLCMCGSMVSVSPLSKVGLPLPPFGVVSAGVFVGELRKGRVIPHHHFFMAYGARFQSRLILDAEDEAVKRYLAGEELSVSDECNGYTAVLLRCGDARLTLGGGKASGGRLKNYYPKGLRIRSIMKNKE